MIQVQILLFFWLFLEAGAILIFLAHIQSGG
jgi:hypothetical protein